MQRAREDELGKSRPVISTELQEDGMANREQKSNREKKKPKADKNKKKSAAPASSFASVRSQEQPAYGNAVKKTP